MVVIVYRVCLCTGGFLKSVSNVAVHAVSRCVQRQLAIRVLLMMIFPASVCRKTASQKIQCVQDFGNNVVCSAVPFIGF